MSLREQRTGKIVLLGPQPRDFSDVAAAVQGLEVDGPVALITAGWQEYENDDSALKIAIGQETVNLELHARSETVAAAEREFVGAWARRQKHLRHLQEFYRVRLDAIDDGAHTIDVRHVDDALLLEQTQITVSQLRHLDEEHLNRCKAVCDRFDEEWKPDERPALVEHREAIAELLSRCKALVISGGHVVALLNRLHLFDVFSYLEDQPVVAWSAGAMTLTERIVLFHDSPPFGKNLAQLLDFGLGLCPDIVVLPDMSRRVRLEHYKGIGRFAQRMAPAHCLGFDPGARLVVEAGQVTHAHDIACLLHDGQIQWGWKP